MNAPRLQTAHPEPASFEGGSGVLSRFGASLRREVDSLEAPESEELFRAVDEELDPSERALWEERLALDPRLARRAADLASFRNELRAELEADLESLESETASKSEAKPKLLTFRRPPARLSLSGWLAAAAVLLLALALRETPRFANHDLDLRAAAPRSLQWSGEELFTDGFEVGDASGWSSVSPSG